MKLARDETIGSVVLAFIFFALACIECSPSLAHLPTTVDESLHSLWLSRLGVVSEADI